MSRERPQCSDSQRRQLGFTLLEILVVTSMIAIMITLAVVSFNLVGSDRGLERQATRMNAIMQMVSEEAQMQGRDFGLELMLEGYRFVEYDPLLNVWYEVIGDDLLLPGQLEEEMEFDLVLEGRRIQLPLQAEELEDPEEDESDKDAYDRDLTDDYLPHILILSSGDISPFELSIFNRFDNASIGLIKELGKDLELVRDTDDI